MYDQTVREKEGRKGVTRQARTEPTTILLRDLEREARASPDREAYREVLRVRESRLGLTAALADSGKLDFVVVILVDRSPRDASIEAVLARRGYASMHLDDGWIAHERVIPRGRIGAELRFLRGLLEPEEESL